MDGGGPPAVDYRAVFECLPSGIALLRPDDLVYTEVNTAYARMAGRKREDLLGRHIFDLFPDNPHNAEANGVRSLGASLRTVAETGRQDSMGLVRYDVQPPDRPGVFEERYWSVINLPVLAPDGSVAQIAHRIEEVTAFIRTRGRLGQNGRGPHELEGELYMRARELQEVNDRLRMAHAREREVALSLQAAMLPDLRPIGHRLAVRYQPAIGALNVCGDWYDVVDLDGDRIVVAVGDVVGHGLEAAGVMGQLRAALSAACRIAPGPAAALESLGLYSRSVSGAESTTAVAAYIDWTTATLTYSNAGHPPAALLHADGTVRFLDRATDPPLGATPDHVSGRPEARLTFTPGSTLVLYTDGMIERRGEDIDTGLNRLATSLSRHRALDPEPLADALLRDLIPVAGATDDTALVIIRL